MRIDWCLWIMHAEIVMDGKKDQNFEEIGEQR